MKIFCYQTNKENPILGLSWRLKRKNVGKGKRMVEVIMGKTTKIRELETVQ